MQIYGQLYCRFKRLLDKQDAIEHIRMQTQVRSTTQKDYNKIRDIYNQKVFLINVT